MKIKEYTQLALHDIDWSYTNNREGKKWAGKVIEKAGFVNRSGSTEEQMFLVLFTDKTFVCVGLEHDDREGACPDDMMLTDNWIYDYRNLKENLAEYHCYVDDSGKICFDVWVQMLLDFGFYKLTEKEALEIRERKRKDTEAREYREYLRLKEKFEGKEAPDGTL